MGYVTKKNIYKEMTVVQVQNGISVRMRNENGFGDLEWVFSDAKEFKTFIGKQFLDAEAVKKLEAEEKKAEHKEK